MYSWNCIKITFVHCSCEICGIKYAVYTFFYRGNKLLDHPWIVRTSVIPVVGTLGSVRKMNCYAWEVSSFLFFISSHPLTHHPSKQQEKENNIMMQRLWCMWDIKDAWKERNGWVGLMCTVHKCNNKAKRIFYFLHFSAIHHFLVMIPFNIPITIVGYCIVHVAVIVTSPTPKVKRCRVEERDGIAFKDSTRAVRQSR